MSFRAFVASRPVVDTPAGDFIGDAKRDPDLPDPKTWDELRGYISLRSSAPEVRDAAYLVWRQYLRHEAKAAA